VVCIKCGVALAGGVGQGQPLDPPIAALLGFFVPGLPNIMLGQVTKGIVCLVGSLVIGAVTGCIGCLVVCPLGAFDAYQIATKRRQGRTVGEWEWF
jgi:TM2 domain-containing membrane protein YozV